VEKSLPFLERPECTPEAENRYTNDGAEDPQKREKEIAAGRTDPQDAKKADAVAAKGCQRSDTNPPRIVAATPYKTGEFAGYKEHPYTIQLSRSFTLNNLATCGSSSAADNKRFWGDPRVTEVKGLSKSQILDNMRGLCINVLDPIKAKYPNMQLTSALRISSKAEGQHGTGQAADFILAGAGQRALYDCALWIRDNVAYDQLLLEYRQESSWIGWIHVSFNPAGNRGINAAYPKVATLVQDKVNSRFLCDLGRT